MKKLKPIIYSLAFIAALYVIIISMLYFFQEYLIFLPTKTEKSIVYDFEYPFEELFLSHQNGEKINGLLFTTKTQSKGLVIYYHGNAKNLMHWGESAGKYIDRNYDVLMVDYRGYGKSDGEASEDNLFEDGLLTYNWARNRYAADSIVIYGRSLGSAVACYVASLKESKALVLESPLSSIEDIVDYKYPYLVFPLIPENNFSNITVLKGIICPVHIIHGSDDEVIPLGSMVKLREFLTSEDSFFVVEGGGHNDLNKFASYQTELDRILK